MKRQGSVRQRLLRLALLLLLPCVAIASVLTWRIFATARQGAETALLATARGLNQLVDRQFQQADLLLDTLAATDELRRSKWADFDRLARVSAMQDSTIVLSDPAGRTLIDTGRPAGARAPAGPAQNLAQAVAGRPAISAVTQPGGTGSTSVRVSLPIAAAGHRPYELTLLMQGAALQALLRAERLQAGWGASILDSRGASVAATGAAERSPIGGRSDARSTRDAVAADGTKLVVASDRSEWSGWTVSVAAPRALILDAGRRSTILLLWLGTGVIVLGVAGALRVARGIAQPIEAMARAAQSLGDGGGWTAVPQGLREADEVARAMFVAFQFLLERREALGALNVSLATSVETRTGELARANAALDEQRRQLDDILNHMPVGVVVHHADGRLLFINREARRLLGLPLLGEVEREHWPSLHQGAHVLAPAEEPSSQARTGVMVEREILSLHVAGRPTAELEFNASPLLGQDGQVSLALTTLQDVTARLEAEEARRRSQRLEAVGQLTGGVSHEFNNLLMAISGCLELLGPHVEGQFGPGSRARTLLANAQRAAGRGAGLTGQLLAFSRRQHLQVEPVDLNALVAGMSQLLEGPLGRLIQVEVQLEEECWLAMADAAQLELVLLNLAINARDAMQAGGRLTIRTASVLTGPPVRAEDPPAGEHAVLHVSDTGHGMPPQVLARVFEPFFTTKNVGRGSGLGLPHVLGVAQQLGGGVCIVSKPGQGTTVSLFLPRALGTLAAPRPALGMAPARTAHAFAGARLLLVDDDLDVREIARSMLEELGAHVIEAGSGAEALIALRTARVNLVLADLTMPKMTGIELAGEVATLFPGLPVVLMTGYGPAAMDDAGPNVRATLRKPFRAEALARVLAAELRLAEV